MKSALLIFIGLFLTLSSFSQTTAQFKESEYLKLDGDFYLTVKGDPTVRLKVKVQDGTTYKESSITVSGVDTVFNYIKSKDYKYNDFIVNDFDLQDQNKLYGDFVQEDNLIKFYPWRFDTTSTIEKKLSKNEYYVLEIPERTVVRVNYRAWHYGALTLPVKFYSNSTDSIGNFHLGASLNLMIGRKWGKKKYSYLAGKAKDSYTIAKSINFILGINSLDLSKSNTNQKITKDISTASLSYGFAFGFQYKKIGLFAAIGLDSPLSKYGKDWVFKEKPWLGFGIGLGL